MTIAALFAALHFCSLSRDQVRRFFRWECGWILGSGGSTCWVERWSAWFALRRGDCEMNATLIVKHRLKGIVVCCCNVFWDCYPLAAGEHFIPAGHSVTLLV